MPSGLIAHSPARASQRRPRGYVHPGLPMIIIFASIMAVLGKDEVTRSEG
jgi:hypothetical protein